MRTSTKTSVFIAAIAGALALLNVATAANAGPAAGPKGGTKEAHGKRAGAAKMIQELNLTETQKTQAKAIQADMMKQRKAITGNKALTPEQKKSQMRTLTMSSMSKIMAILTPEQKKTLQKKMEESRARMHAMQPKKGTTSAAHKM